MNAINEFRQIRKTIELHEIISTESKKGNDFYRLDRNSTARYFDIHPKWMEKVMKYFDCLKSRGIKIVHVDICGRTSAESLGADKSYCFSLKTSEIKKAFSDKQQVFFDGDIFNSNDFSQFIKMIKKENPALVTFEPVAGLQNYGPEKKVEGVSLYKKITYQRLVKRLCTIIEVVRPGGLIYLERPFQFDANHFVDAFISRKSQNQFALSLALKKIARKMKCKIEIKSEIGGPYFLIQTKA